MIFVAVGTQKFQFNRLLAILDKLIANGEIQEEVFAQIGHSDYRPQNYDFEQFLNNNEFDEKIRKSDLLITHSGVATIIAGLKHDKPVIVVPRMEKFGEHVDDHQVQIAESFSEQNFIMMCGEKDDLGEIIQLSRTYAFSKYFSQRELMMKTIREYLDSI